ncbi:MAG: Rieske 2Fe-2S domain-containing protein [Bacteroidetes bacterium]|nr:Rieske 2Fe-2S domain-containing protein [Bacteroidota bacterium]
MLTTPQELEWYLITEDPNGLPWEQQPILSFTINNRAICLAQFQGKFFAFQSLCPHAGAPLKDGYIDVKGNIVCPLHHYKFCLSNGRNCTGQGYDMRTYPLEIRPDGLYIGLRK